MNKYKVFISYSHNDRKVVEEIASSLKQSGLSPVWDKNILFGHFDEQIKMHIEHSHIFMPLLTPASMKRGWVHQEIGYAMALNIPVVPVSKGKLPGQMLQMYNAIFVNQIINKNDETLSYDYFDKLVKQHNKAQSTYYTADQFIERAQMMTKLANEADSLIGNAFIRQKAALTSFSIPHAAVTDPIWRRQYDKNNPDPYRWQQHLDEREALEKNARKSGCKLILNPEIALNGISKASAKARLENIVHFLDSMKDDMIDVAFARDQAFSRNVTIVGDWFSAESYYNAETKSYMQTMISTYAPGILGKIESFDNEFNDLMLSSGITYGASRKEAIKKIRAILENL